jgi:hypothetical protein
METKNIDNTYIQLKKVEAALQGLGVDKELVNTAISVLLDEATLVEPSQSLEADDVVDTSDTSESESETEDVDDSTPTPREKKQYVIVVSDPEGKIEVSDYTGWVVQIPESESISTVLENINNAAYDYNASKKGRKSPVFSVGEALEDIPTKFFKNRKVFIKTKEAVFVKVTDNTIPKE